MNKEFIPYEQALELKELGFNEQCSSFYYKDLGTIYQTQCAWDVSNDDIYYSSEKVLCSSPTFSQAFRWFREKYGLYSEIFVDDNKTFGFYITSFIEEGRLDKPITRQFSSYEEAELGCVRQLIEIVKNK